MSLFDEYRRIQFYICLRVRVVQNKLQYLGKTFKTYNKSQNQNHGGYKAKKNTTPKSGWQLVVVVIFHVE
jgi:hypothetical protein